MSGLTGAWVVGVVLFVVAGAVVWLAWRVRRSPVVWMRVPDSRDVHAIRKVELRAKAPEVGSVGLCGGPWLVAELERATRAEGRCPRCVREVRRLAGGGT